MPEQHVEQVPASNWEKKYCICIFTEKLCCRTNVFFSFKSLWKFKYALGTEYIQNLNTTCNYHKADNKRGEERWTFTVRRQDDICLGACSMPTGNVPTCSNTQDCEREHTSNLSAARNRHMLLHETRRTNNRPGVIWRFNQSVVPENIQLEPFCKQRPTLLPFTVTSSLIGRAQLFVAF